MLQLAFAQGVERGCRRGCETFTVGLIFVRFIAAIERDDRFEERGIAADQLGTNFDQQVYKSFQGVLVVAGELHAVPLESAVDDYDQPLAIILHLDPLVVVAAGLGEWGQEHLRLRGLGQGDHEGPPIIALRDHDVVMRAEQRLVRVAVQVALAPLLITNRSIVDLGAAGVATGDRPALGGDGMVHGVKQIGRGTVIGLEATANTKDTHRSNAPGEAVPQGVSRGKDLDPSLIPILSNEFPPAPPRERPWPELALERSCRSGSPAEGDRRGVGVNEHSRPCTAPGVCGGRKWTSKRWRATDTIVILYHILR